MTDCALATGLPYPRLVHELLVLFLDEAIPGLQAMIDSAFSTFSTDKVGLTP